MKTFYLLLAVAFAGAASPLFGQDTVRIAIGIIEYNADSTEIDVPVFGEFPEGISDFQFSINYDTSILELDTVAFSESLPSSFGRNFNLVEAGQIRFLFNTFGPTPLSLGEDGLLLTMHFEIEIKRQGVFPIEFGDEIDMEFIDVDGNIVPHVSTNGAVILQPSFALLELADSVITTGLREVCLPLTGAYLPTVSAFRYDLKWDEAHINLTDINLGANPLSLTGNNFVQSPGRLEIERLGSPSDTISALPIFTELLQLCFTGSQDPGGSAIELDRDASFYQIPWRDSVQNISLAYPSGGLAFRSDLDNSQVELTIGIAENGPDSDTLCVPVIANDFDQVGEFTLALKSYSLAGTNDVELVSIGNPHPSFEAEAFTFLPNRVKVGYTPTLPGGISLMAGDTLFDMCYHVTDSCASAIIAEQSYPVVNSFTRYERFSNSNYTIPHRINQGGLTFQDGLIWLSLDTITSINENEEFELNLRNFQASLPLSGMFILRFPTDSLTLRSAQVSEPLTNASISILEHPEGALISISPTGFNGGNLWPADNWFSFTFSSNFDIGNVKIDIASPTDASFLAVKDGELVSVPANFFPGLFILNRPVAVSEDRSVEGHLYPNPITIGQELNIIVPEFAGKNGDLQIVDITGKMIHTSTIRFDGTGAVSSPFPRQPAGAYVLRLSTDTGDVFQRVVLVH